MNFADSLILTIALMGDLLPGNVLKNRIPPDSGFILFEKVSNFIKECDLSFANFEGTFEGEGKEREKEFRFIVPLSSLKGLKKSGIKEFQLQTTIFELRRKISKKTYEILKKGGFIIWGPKGTHPYYFQNINLNKLLSKYIRKRPYPGLSFSKFV